MTKCEAQGPMRSRVCLSVKHLSQMRGNARDEAQWLPNALPLWDNTHVKVANVQSRSWKSKQATNWAPKISLERSWSLDAKIAPHCSFKIDLHELWSKEGVGVKFPIWLLAINPLKARAKWSLIRVCYTPLETYFEGL
jgi:hypothetical protein